MHGARNWLTLLALCALFAVPLAAQTELRLAPGSAETLQVEAPIAVEAPLDDNAPGTENAVADPADRPTSAVPAVENPTVAGDAAQSPIATAPLPADDSAVRAALETYVDGVALSLQRGHNLAALSMAVVKDDALWLAKGYGQADLADARALQPDNTLFRIGSVSKTFIWTAVMMLVERGQLDLDADVNSYLKTVRIAQAFGTPVTMRHLMHHRAGFEDSLQLFAVADDDPRTLAELLTQQQPQRVYAPGLRTSYSNWGAALAAQIVEDVSGQAYGDFLRLEILEPLAMHATLWTAPAKLTTAQRTDLASGYKTEAGALGLQGYMQLGAYWPAGGIASTANDMARWMRLHLNGGELEGIRLLRAQTHAQMWTRAYDDRIGAPDLAHGFQDRTFRGLRVLGHGGATAAFLSNMVLVPELRLGVFVSQNSAQTRLAIGQLPELIIDHLRGGAYQARLAVEASDPGALAEVAGTYLQNRRVFSTFAALFGLDASASVAVRSADTLILTMGDEVKQYQRVGKERDLFEAADAARIAFVREGGRVVALADSSGVHTLEKVGPLAAPMTLFGALLAALLLACSTLLGFCWRLGRGAAYGAGIAAGLAATVSLLASLCVLGFAVVTGLLIISLSSLDLSTMAANYPNQAMLHLHYGGWVIAAAALAMLLALWPAWVADGWGLWRRMHFGLFTLILALAAGLLWHWRVYGAPVY